MYNILKKNMALNICDIQLSLYIYISIKCKWHVLRAHVMYFNGK